MQIYVLNSERMVVNKQNLSFQGPDTKSIKVCSIAFFPNRNPQQVHNPQHEMIELHGKIYTKFQRRKSGFQEKIKNFLHKMRHFLSSNTFNSQVLNPLQYVNIQNNNHTFTDCILYQKFITSSNFHDANTFNNKL